MRLIAILFLLFLVSLQLPAQDIPRELEDMGFTEEILVSYDREDDLEHFTFLDWQSEQFWDTVIFVVNDGEVIDWFRQGVEP